MSLTVPANAVVYFATDGGLATTSNGAATVEVAVFVDGLRVQGGLRRVSVAAATTDVSTWSLSLSLPLDAKTAHTVDVRARYVTGFASVMVSGGSASALRGELTALLLNR